MGGVSSYALEGRKYLSLVTYRRNGLKVSTPVWFVRGDDHIYVWTIKTSGKVKRIRNNPNVAFAPCKLRGDPLGPYAEGMATISLDDSSKGLRSRFRAKYGLQFTLDGLLSRLLSKKRVFLEITPA